MRCSESKKASPITSQTVKYLEYQIHYYKTRLENVQNACNHDFEVLDSWDGWDGYSWVNCEIKQDIHCKICGLRKIRNTGKFTKH